MVALAVAAAGVAPVAAPMKDAGNQSEGRGAVRTDRKQGTGKASRGKRPVGSRGGDRRAAALGQTGHSPKSIMRTCSCSGRLTPRDRRLDACICRSRAWATSDALKVVAEEERAWSVGQPAQTPTASCEGRAPGTYQGRSARPQWLGRSCQAPSPAGGHFGSPS